ncbi:MAG TPA: hypothetical protein VFR70_05035 [Flavobacterium sp.]|nr:hypothetical protein [Flavobacterium sp.]
MKALKIVSDLLPIPSYTVIIICFFFPFLTIKCNTTELVSVTGFDYVIGNDIKDKMESSGMAKALKEKMGGGLLDPGNQVSDGSETSRQNDEAGNRAGMPEDTRDEKNAKMLFFSIMLVPLLMAFLGLVLSFIRLKNKPRFHIIFSSIGFLFLLGYGIIIKASEDVNSLSSMGEGISAGMISINLGNAYFTAMIFFLMVAMFFGMERYLAKLYRKEQEIRNDAPEQSYSGEQ